jgi:hypothetical protein
MRLYAENNENQNPETNNEKRPLSVGERIIVGTFIAGGVGLSVYGLHLGLNAIVNDTKAVGTGIKAGVDKLKTNKEDKQKAIATLMAAGYSEEEAKRLI